mgnify:CR=1 FL=1
MTMNLNQETVPNDLPVMTHPFKNGVHVGDYFISDKDMAALVYYWLNNTDHSRRDARSQLVSCIKDMEVVPGYSHPDNISLGKGNEGSRKFESKTPYIITPGMIEAMTHEEALEACKKAGFRGVNRRWGKEMVKLRLIDLYFTNTDKQDDE